MEDLKKKLMENMENDNVFVFKHLFYGKMGQITPNQFIDWLPKVDLAIIVIFTLYALLHVTQYNPTRFEGIVKLFLWSCFFFFVCALITAVFYLQHKVELKKPQGSIIYKAYFMSRVVFQTFATLVIFALYFVEKFLNHFHDITIDADVKESIEMSMEKMPYRKGTLQFWNLVFIAFALLALTHQLYWSIYLDISWCSCNYIQLEKLAEEKIKKNQGEDSQEEQQNEQAK